MTDAGFWRCCAFAAALLVPAGSSAQEIADTLFDARTRIELRRVVEESERAGLPRGPLVNLVLQGAARGADANRVIAVVRSYSDSMRVARRVLGDSSTGAEIDAGAAALRVGVSHDGLRRVRGVRRPGQATTALVVVADLVRRGITATDAADAVSKVAQRRTDADLLSLQTAVARESAGTGSAIQRLEAAVQRHLRNPPMPDDGADLRRPLLSSQASARPRAVTGAGLSSAASEWPGADAATTIDLFGSLGSLERVALFGSAHASTERDVIPVAWRGGATREWRLGSRAQGAAWFAAESKLLERGAGVRDTASGVPRLGSRDVAFTGGFSVVRSWSKRLALGMTFEARRDRVIARFAEQILQHPPGSDTIVPGPFDTLPPLIHSVRETNLNRERMLFVTSLQASFGATLISAGLTHRVTPAPGTGVSGSSFMTVNADHRLTERASLFGQLTSSGAASVLGSATPSLVGARLGLRFIEGARVSPSTGDAVDVEMPSVTATRAPFAAGDSATTVQVRVRASRARRVFLMGDITGWQPKELAGDGAGVFAAAFAYAGSMARVRLRIDDGPWQPPPGIPVVNDEFGGGVGVVVIASPAAREADRRD
jgi:hypothetical protein